MGDAKWPREAGPYSGSASKGFAPIERARRHARGFVVMKPLPAPGASREDGLAGRAPEEPAAAYQQGHSRGPKTIKEALQHG